ncbi:hypothetical protein SO802_030603, partial [Lithocarpus litseifolius]
DDEEHPKYIEFRAKVDMPDPVFEKRMLFSDHKEFKRAVQSYRIKHGYPLLIVKNESRKVSYKCKNCEWYIYASWDRKENSLLVKTYREKHKCSRAYHSRMVFARWIAVAWLEVFRGRPNIKSAEIKEAACKTGFLEECRPIISLDACHLRGFLKGQLLAAVGIDRNDGMYPIAFAVCESETKDSWSWFPELFLTDIGPVREHGWTFFSNQQKILYHVLVLEGKLMPSHTSLLFLFPKPQMGKKSKIPREYNLEGKKRDLCPHCHDIYQGDSELEEHKAKCRKKGSIDSVSLEYGRSGQDSLGEQSKVKVSTSMDSDKPLLVKEDASGDYPLTANIATVVSLDVLEMQQKKLMGGREMQGREIVPGYYLRKNTDGLIENSTCVNNTASEHVMVERLILDDLLHWAVHYKVDGFRFDLMGHIMKNTMLACLPRQPRVDAVSEKRKEKKKKNDTDRTPESGESYRYRCPTRVGHRHFGKDIRLPQFEKCKERRTVRRWIPSLKDSSLSHAQKCKCRREGMHSIPLVDERDEAEAVDLDYEQIDEISCTPMSREPTNEFTEFIQVHQCIRDREVHSQLQMDLVEHLWQLHGES